MQGELFLGLDVGTQGTKALLIDVEHARVLARSSSAYGLIAGLPDGAAEQDPATWITACASAVRALFEGRESDRARVAGIGVSGQQHGLVLLDRAGRVLRAAKLWCDTSTAAEAELLSQRFGQRVPTGYTASKVLWTARHEPEIWSRTASVLLPHDYVNCVLSAERWTDAGDASGTGWFDVRARCFDLEQAAAIDPALPSRLARIAAADELPAVLSRAGADLLGLSPKIPLCAGSGDNMESALGSGASEPGTLVLSLGTSGTAFVVSERPLVDQGGLIAPFCDATGRWLPLLCVMNATAPVQEVRAAFGLTHAELDRRALATPIGAQGLVWVPFLQGERVPDLPHARGVLAGQRTGWLDPGALARAAVEGVACNLADGIERLMQLGVAIERLHVVGGAAKSALWCTVLADVLQLPLVPLEESETGALGAALHAAWAVRRSRGERIEASAVARPFVREAGQRFEPDPEQRSACAELRARFSEWRERAFGSR